MRIFAQFIAVLLVLICSARLLAQEQLGLRIENYSGINSVMLNPAAGLSYPLRWDVNLIAAGLYGESNYGYLRNTNLLEAMSKADKVQQAIDFETESEFPSDALILEYYDNEFKKFALIGATATGPSVLLNIWDGISFGFFTRLRAMSVAQQIPGVLNYYTFDRTPFFQDMNVAPFEMAAMLWSELGFHAGFEQPMVNGRLAIGANIKFLNGYESFYFQNLQFTDITQIPGDTIGFANASVEFGLTTSNTKAGSFERRRNGGGLAADLGAVYTIDGFDDTVDGAGNGYSWKFGLSLLDFGKIKFNKNAEVHRIDTDQSGNIALNEYSGFDDAQDYVRLLSQQTLGSPGASFESKGYSIWLPAAVSLQADYALRSSIFVNAVAVLRTPFGHARVERANLLALSARLEKRWYGAALPLVLYNWSDLRMGFSLRLAFLTVGSENIGSILGVSQFTGSDIYFALKINPFNLGWNIGGKGRSKGKNVKCYEF